MDFGKQLSNVEAATEAAKTKMIPVVSAMIGDGKKILDPLTESATVYRDHLRKAENAMKRTALGLICPEGFDPALNASIRSPPWMPAPGPTSTM